MSRGNLLWSVDESSGSFASLPAGPLLIPGLIILGLFRLFSRGIGGRIVPAHKMLPRHVIESARYRRDCARYHCLNSKYFETGELEDTEWIERGNLHYPDWNNGRRWFYGD